jgi:hypothetical protein
VQHDDTLSGFSESPSDVKGTLHLVDHNGDARIGRPLPIL